jgi:flagellin
MRLNTNIQAMAAQRSAKTHSEKIAASAGKISSGSRVESAANDAASLAISAKLNSTLRSDRQAIRSANDAVSYLQVAEGSLQSINQMVVRMRELALQASNQTYDDSQRTMLDIEIQGLRNEIERTAESTELNGKKLLIGKDQKFDVLINKSKSSEDKITIDLSKLAQSSHALGIFDVSVSNHRRARASIDKIDFAIESLSKSLAEIGSHQARITGVVGGLETNQLSGQAALSQIKDTDIAQESAEHAASSLQLQSATSVLKITQNFGNNVVRLLE